MSINREMRSENARPVTEQQWSALRRVCEHQNIPAPDPFDFYIDPERADTIGLQANGMYIGIETDGYAHT